MFYDCSLLRLVRWALNVSLVRYALALGVCLHTGPQASAIVINDAWFAASGGDPANVSGTLDAGYAAAREFSYQEQFLSVGTWGHCTGTWIGNDVLENKSYFLTAAHCFETSPALPDATVNATFVDWAGNVVASGPATFHLPPERYDPGQFGCGGGACSDIGVIELSGVATIRDAQGALVPRPLLYDGAGEFGVTNAFVGYGSWGIGSQGSNGGLFPSSGPRRAGGTNVINSLFESGKGIGTRFDAPGSPTAGVHESAVASGDSGSAWWQQHDGRWAIIATTNGGSGTTYGTSSTGARVSRYIDWIESIYSDVQRWSVLLGDVNRDGFVRGNGLGDPAVDDFSAFILGWRQPNTAASPNHADLNGDGTADLADFWLLREALQASGQGPIRAELLGMAVPEPSASWLALSAAAPWRRRRSAR